MEWHCSYFWEHALDKEQILNSKRSFQILTNQIAIPILLKKSIFEYQKLGDGIASLFSID